MNTIQVTTPCGVVEGFQEDGVNCFLGIPYATAKRFEYPQPVVSWKGICDAKKYGPAPIQQRAYVQVDASDPQNHYEHEFYQNFQSEYSEDCLNLNIWTPENPLNCPVLVIIYGGGLVTGQNNSPECNGSFLAKHGIITVAMNYRVNIFGFIAMKELEDENGKSGNYGYYDQQAAIAWVRHNIQSFGGDVNNMTLIGQSAGATSCETQIKSPLNKGIFKQAIIQSSAGLASFIKQKPDNTKEYAKWRQVYERTGCKSIEEFKQLPAKTLYDAFAEVSAKSSIGFCNAVYDENFTSGIKNQPCPVKIMCSVTSEDVMPFLLYWMCGFLAKSQRKLGVDTYTYYFRRQLPGDTKGAWHGSDLIYLYGWLSHSWRPFGKEDYMLQENILAYLINFIKTGNPNGEGLAEWTPYNKSKKFMVFDENPARMGKPERLRLLKNTLHPNGLGM